MTGAIKSGSTNPGITSHTIVLQSHKKEGATIPGVETGSQKKVNLLKFRFSHRFYRLSILLVVLLILAWLFPQIYPVIRALVQCFVAIVLADGIMIFYRKTPVEGARLVQERLSNGDPNFVKIQLHNLLPFSLTILITDEVPEQFQWRNFSLSLKLTAGNEQTLEYTLLPKQRGEYHFGKIRLLMHGPIGLVVRHFSMGESTTCKVYPGFLQMRHFELLAATDRLTEAGIKSLRKIGHQLEFDQIRDYVNGDDYRTINWKATASKSKLMVNQYQDEKSQPVYSLIDMGRPMKLPFGGMQLLDYAINAALVISNIAMVKQDKAGILTFNQSISGFLPADRRNLYLMRIMEMLYNQESSFVETDYENLYAFVSRKIRQRSLLILYSNFESMVSMERIKSVLVKLSRSHPLLVIFFENAEVAKLLSLKSKNMEEIYLKTIAEQLLEEKRQIVKELNRFGIYSLLTAPEKLNINLINKYLEFKASGII